MKIRPFAQRPKRCDSLFLPGTTADSVHLVRSAFFCAALLPSGRFGEYCANVPFASSLPRSNEHNVHFRKSLLFYGMICNFILQCVANIILIGVKYVETRIPNLVIGIILY